MHPNEHRNGYQLSTKWALTLGSDCQSSAAGLYAGRGCALIDGSGNMFEYGTSICGYYTVSQKKTSPTFLAITRESIDGFL